MRASPTLTQQRINLYTVRGIFFASSILSIQVIAKKAFGAYSITTYPYTGKRKQTFAIDKFIVLSTFKAFIIGVVKIRTMKVIIVACLCDIVVQIELFDGLAVIHLKVLHTKMIKIERITEVASLADTLLNYITLLIIKFNNLSTSSIERDERCLTYLTMTIISYLKAVKDER